jgi:hypothetical protein
MATLLIVMCQGRNSRNWQVYRDDDSPRKPGDEVRIAGPLVGSVHSWGDLDALAAEQGVEDHQITGDGLAEMEQELGPKA